MIAALFREIAAEHFDELAIIDGDRRITYGALSTEVNRARSWLGASLKDGGEGQVIAVCLKNSWQFVASFFAIAENGGIFLPVNPNWRGAELRRFSEQLPTGGAITTQHLRAEWDVIADLLPKQSILTWETAAAGEEKSRSAPIVRSGDAPLAYLLTSGSTGIPKVVPRSAKNFNFGATRVADAIQVTRGSRWLSAIPFFHSWGLGTGMLLPLLCGATLVILPQFHAAECAELIRRERINVLMASPFAYGFLAERIANKTDLRTLERCFWTGSRMNAAVEHTWVNRFEMRLRPWYGMSEAHAIAIDVGDGSKASGEGFVGRGVPGVEIRVFDSSGGMLGCGETGEIAVRSDGVMSGYVGGGEDNRKFFHGSFFRTGDLGRLDASGDLYLSGRVRTLINVAGLKVDATEVERVIEMLDAVAACRVDSVPGGPAGELIRARIVPRGGRELTRREIVVHCREQLAEYKIPRIVEFEVAVSASWKQR